MSHLLGLCLPPDSSDSELELSMVRHQPEGLEQLQAQTKFTKKELQSLYRGFKNVSDPHPSGEALTHPALLPLAPGRGILAQADLLEIFMEQQISWGLNKAHVLWDTCPESVGQAPESVLKVPCSFLCVYELAQGRGV